MEGKKDNGMDFVTSLCEEYRAHNYIDPSYYERWGVKRGLRNADGTGVLAGVTQIGNVLGYYVQDGERYPMDGKLIYRGINVEELIDGFMREGRFGFEETAYLLLFGALPDRTRLEEFKQALSDNHTLPKMFTEDMILKAPSPDVMNKLARSVLALYSYDDNPDDLSLANQLRQAIQLIARVPVIVAHAFAVKRHYYNDESLYRHGGANKKVMEMFRYIESDVKDWKDDEEVKDYLGKILRKETGDRSGLIYGMGHAIYTLSDPRAVLLKKFARELAETKGMLDEFQLFEAVERLTPSVLADVKGDKKVVCANIDLYSGFVYKMMGIPEELYTPLFAMARVVGWCAHRLEEVGGSANRIIRPAYKAVAPLRPFVPLDQR